MIKKLKKVNNPDAFSELVSSMIGLLVISIMLVISITFIKAVNQQSVLNEFANQMIFTVCDAGQTGGNDIDDRYEELETVFNISPDITYNANYISSNKVQYGETIEMTVKSQMTIKILMFEQTMNFSVSKQGRSKYYWK